MHNLHWLFCVIWRQIGSHDRSRKTGLQKRSVLMKNLETCDWMLLNSIIYKIYTTEDLDEMRREFLEQLRLVVDLTVRIFILPATMKRTKWRSRWRTIVRCRTR